MAIRMSGMVSNLDTDAIIKELMSAQSLKKTKVENNKTKLEWKQEKWEEMNTKIYALYTEQLTKMKLEGSYLTKKASSSNEDKATASSTTAANGSYALQVSQLASAQYITGADIKSKNLTLSSTLMDAGFEGSADITITVKRAASAIEEESDAEGVEGEDAEEGESTPENGTVTTKTLTVDSETTVGDFIDQLKSAGLNASFDVKQGRFYISAKSSGVENSFTITSDAVAGEGLETLGLGNITEALATSGQISTNSSTMAVVAAKDSRATLNGAEITGATNSITANGLTVKLVGTTSAGETINITVDNDTDAVYNMIKETVTKYNELLKSMDESYSADSAKGYAMLSAEDKEAMSEEQVKLWEDKIKGSLLRRDDTLNSIMNTMRSALQHSVEVDGKTYSLSSFGIVTGTYTEKGLLHINGNADDGEYASKTDQLKEALNTDPETVSKVLAKTFSSLYSDLTDKMKASSISSALTFYNDKQIKSQIDDYKTDISNWEDRLLDLEDRYYRQYTAMETSMAKLQSQQNSLGNMLG